MSILEEYTELLDLLETAHISYTIRHIREDSLAVLVTMPGERWEVEYALDGEIKIGKFVSQFVDLVEDLRAELDRKIQEDLKGPERDR